MMFGELAAIGLGHFLVAWPSDRLRESGRRRSTAHAAARRRAIAPPLRGPAPAPALNCSRRSAQHRLHVRELDARNVEQVGDLLHGDARRRPACRRLRAHARTCTSRNTRIRSGRCAQASTNCCMVDSRSKSGLLPRVKCCDGGVDLRAVEPQLGHHLARGGDLRLRDAPVGLGDVPHDLERGGEEALADLEHACATAGAAHARRRSGRRSVRGSGR